MKFKINKELVKSIVITFGYILLIIILWQILSSFFVSKVTVSSFVSKAGVFGPLLFILLQITQNIIAPIAHYPILYASGVLFGPILGFVYNWIGTCIGTFLIFVLVKKFGRPLVNKMVSKKFIEKYDNLIKKISPFGLFLMYVLPVFPDDEISYLVGVSSMPMKDILVAILLGKLGGATLAILANNPIKGLIPAVIVHIIAIIVAILYFYRKVIVQFIKRIIKK